MTRLLERYAGRYIVFVLLLSAGTWFATGNTDAMLAVLVASCPCALVLAAPATAVAAVAVAARHGILIKGVGFLEQLADVDFGDLRQDGHVDARPSRGRGLEPAPGILPEEFMTRRRQPRRGEHASGEPRGGGAVCRRRRPIGELEVARARRDRARRRPSRGARQGGASDGFGVAFPRRPLMTGQSSGSRSAGAFSAGSCSPTSRDRRRPRPWPSCARSALRASCC